MRFNKKCPICKQLLKEGQDVQVERDLLHHTLCLNKVEEQSEKGTEKKLKKAILNFDNMNDFIEFNLDLEELAAYVQQIKSNKYFVTFTGPHDGFACLYTNDDSLKEVIEFIEEQRTLCEHELYITSVIRNRKFVKWEIIPASVKILEG